MKRIFRRRPPHWLTLIVIVLLFVLVRLGQQLRSGGSSASPLPLPEGAYRLERVVDGDTLIVRPGPDTASQLPPDFRARIRLAGVDAPESVRPDHPVERWGPESSQFTEDFLSGGQLTLQFGRRRIDRYDRYLAFVFVGETLLNEELARAGLARVKIYSGEESSLTNRLVKAEQEARNARRGIWSGTPP